MRGWRSALGGFFCLVVLAAAAALADDHVERKPVSAAAEYRVQPGDVLFVSVWKEKDLEGEILVRPDGGVSFPLAGDLQAAGHTVD